MIQPLPEGLREVGRVTEENFEQIDQLLKAASPATERLSYTQYPGHPIALAAEHVCTVEAVLTPFVADIGTPYQNLQIGIDIRGKGYYEHHFAKTGSFWHAEASSRSASNIAHLATWFLVDTNPVDSSNELRALTWSMLVDEYGMSPESTSSLTPEELAVFGLAIYQDSVPGRIIDYSGFLHKVPDVLRDNPDRAERIFARTTLL